MPKKNSFLPHSDVFVRLQKSKIHGVGVFAIVDIPKGTNIVKHDDQDAPNIPGKLVRKLPKHHRELYERYCPYDGENDSYSAPPSFNCMGFLWYLNDSKKPNLKRKDDFHFIAIRRIRKGEEIFLDYTAEGFEGD